MAFCETRPLKSIWPAPELFTTSGGLPSTKRGWSVLLISAVAECLISAFGYRSLYMASWALA